MVARLHVPEFVSDARSDDSSMSAQDVVAYPRLRFEAPQRIMHKFM